MKHNIFRYIIVFGLISNIVGCVTPLHQSIEEVQKGMSKSDVVESLGSPKFTSRYKGQDIWRYVYYKEGVPYSRSIFFEAGYVIKVTKSKRKPYLLDQALRADSLQEYEKRIDLYHKAQKKESL